MADVEFVFVNDCTPDKSIEVLREVMREYPDVNARIVDHATNKGLFCARRTAMDNATGEYWIHCDSDDWVEPDYCEKLYNAAVAENADIACCKRHNGMGGDSGKATYDYEYETIKDTLSPKNISVVKETTCNKLVRASVYKDNGIMPWQGISAWEDVFLTTRLRVMAHKIVVIKDALYHYNNINNTSMTKTFSLSTYKDRIAGTRMLEAFFKEKGIEGTEELIKYMKVKSRLGLMFSATEDAVRTWKTAFPESTNYIWSTPNVRFPEKALGWLLSVLPVPLGVCL
jgi:Predicted glycosyltransferases